ncbi:hypothetical protein AAJ63_gp271 [Synechococcus phage ACG-2014f]|uniref:Uncharacterized protein n=1 Tax=Synechococcus phage ACG-2014f TaxID=1493511 RepID=A0A0E3FNS6_9CAUD|nr:hypothetical protein AAJ63_gp271 [Synechococcus phage ACG-2014f]AIX20444.1 hypothetical protein Syn7803C80_267 [Synechococcus phage ACG-2014f]AIX21882.1 hypothetical protein Syn7803C90_271 [Synechococcus phage ACG-2014f]AIX30167.1 hypothetical protein Syn7803US34_272 [Synechococcus phage ACG-2014f]AIX30750.1 hypothetical protein Syn7803US37_273 [Synechococcus phage ACG-2014f]AIX42200.1 hypothetical protein Syn7803C15_269 [Synechococcus phage ACG-2014f]
MSLSITTATTTHDGVVTDVQWAYTTSEGIISGGHTMQGTPGSVSLENVNESVISGWLEEQMDTSHFDRLCSERGFPTEEEKEDRTFNFSETGTMEEVVAPEPEPEPEPEDNVGIATDGSSGIST